MSTRSTHGDRRSIFIVEDDLALAADLRDFFVNEGWEVEMAASLKEAATKLEHHVFDLILADYSLPDAEVLGLFEEVQRRSPLTKVLVMTGHRDPGIVAQSFKKGAADFIFKPFELCDLEKAIDRLLEERRLRVQSEMQREDSKRRTRRPQVDMVGRSPSMLKISQLIDLVADKDFTVLVTGESGTGKELVSRAIHSRGLRREKPFIAINCSAIPDHLLEDELFGHVPGAFTDAQQVRIGKFEAAQEGTLFLDEIGEMPLPLQAKILRVLEEKQVQRLGSNEPIHVDTRIIAATNCDLADKVKRGGFRADLYYRLNMVPIQLPPLRERREDLPLLATYLLNRTGERLGGVSKGLNPSSLRRLLSYDWPGNVRELRNVLELAALLSGDRTILQAEDFPALERVEDLAVVESPQLQQTPELPENGLDLSGYLSRLERHLILQSIERAGGNKQKAADLLALKRTTLVAKLRRMGLLKQDYPVDVRHLSQVG